MCLERAWTPVHSAQHTHTHTRRCGAWRHICVLSFSWRRIYNNKFNSRIQLPIDIHSFLSKRFALFFSHFSSLASTLFSSPPATYSLECFSSCILSIYCRVRRHSRSDNANGLQREKVSRQDWAGAGFACENMKNNRSTKEWKLARRKRVDEILNAPGTHSGEKSFIASACATDRCSCDPVLVGALPHRHMARDEITNFHRFGGSRCASKCMRNISHAFVGGRMGRMDMRLQLSSQVGSNSNSE